MDYCPLCEKLYVYDFYNVCLVFMGLSDCGYVCLYVTTFRVWYLHCHFL